MKTQEIVHQWAQQNGDQGKCGNVFYENKTIYSYGYHFKLAQFYDGIVLVNSDSYSVSTSKHQNYVRGAISHLTSVSVPILFDPDKNASFRNLAHKTNLEYLAGCIDNNIKSLATARKKESYISAIQYNIENLRLYIDRMNVPKTCQGVLTKLYYEHGFEVNEQVLQNIREVKKSARVKAQAKARRDATKWINRTNEKHFSSSDPVFLRLSEDGENVETSQGVRVPTDQARLLFAVVKRSAINGTSLNSDQLNGCGQIGYYSINRIVKGDITAGCHHIKYKEIAEFAKRVSW